MAKIDITMLGTFEITVDGEPVLPQLPQSRKASLLVQYLLLHRDERVPHRVLTGALWNMEGSSNPDMALRAIMHRFRNIITQSGASALENCIVTSRGYYQWNNDLDCEIDVYTFKELAERAWQEPDAARKAELCDQVVGMYTGKLLPASAGEPWVERTSVQLHTQYHAALLALLSYYKKAENHSRIEAICRRALVLDPYEERLYLELIMALQAQEKQTEADEVIRRGNEQGCLHMAVRSRSVGTAYHQMQQADSNVENDIGRISAVIADDDMTGAYSCGYETFKDLYRLQCRIQAQYGMPIYLGLLTVMPPKNTTEDEIKSVMKRVGELACSCLRCSDVVARCSDTQYILLLCGAVNEDGTNPMENIKTEFYREPNYGKYMLTCRLRVPEMP